MTTKDQVWLKYAKIFEATNELPTLLPLVAEFAELYFESNRTSIALTEDEGEMFEVFTLDQKISSLSNGVVFPGAGSILYRVVREARTLTWSHSGTAGADIDGDDLFDAKRLVQGGYHACVDSPLIWAGEVIGTLNVGFFADREVTETEKEVLEALGGIVSAALGMKKYRDALRAKDRFISMISHELQTPLHLLVGSASVLDQSRLDKEQRTCLRQIEAGAGILTNMIQDILSLSQFQTQQFTMEPSVLKLRDILAPLREIGRHMCSKAGLEFRFESSGEESAFLRADWPRLQQVVLCLLSNAVKFTEEGHVRLSISMMDGPALRFEVEDSGIGIEAEHIPNLSRQFYQIEDPNSRQYGGAGLGLSVSEALLAKMDSQLEIKSSPGEGATFSFEVTVLAMDCAQRGPEANEVKIADAEKLLIIDDDEGCRTLAQILAKRMGFSPLLAKNGQEGLEQYHEEKPSVILMDLQMPVMDGFEATEKIREHAGENNPVIIAVSGNSLEADRKRALEIGMNDYLPKPFTLSKLRECLGACRT